MVILSNLTSRIVVNNMDPWVNVSPYLYVSIENIVTANSRVQGI